MKIDMNISLSYLVSSLHLLSWMLLSRLPTTESTHSDLLTPLQQLKDLKSKTILMKVLGLHVSREKRGTRRVHLAISGTEEIPRRKEGAVMPAT